MNDSIQQPNWNLAFAIDSLKHAFQDISGEMERLPVQKRANTFKRKTRRFFNDSDRNKMKSQLKRLEKACDELILNFFETKHENNSLLAAHGYRISAEIVNSAYELGAWKYHVDHLKELISEFELNKGGNITGKNSKLRADKWRVPFLAFAVALRTANPHLSKAAIILAFQKSPKSNGLKLPSENKDMSCALKSWEEKKKLSVKVGSSLFHVGRAATLG